MPGIAKIHQHMAAFPHAGMAQDEFVGKLAAYERTLHALNESIRLLLDIEVEDDKPLFDIAALVERLTRQRALDRFFNLYREGPSH